MYVLFFSPYKGEEVLTVHTSLLRAMHFVSSLENELL